MIIIMSNAPNHKGGPIPEIEDLDDILPSTPPKTGKSISESDYSEWRSTTSRGSDEIEFLDMRTAVPLRDVRGNHVVAPVAPPKAWSGR